MRKILRLFVHSLLKNDFCWKIIDTLFLKPSDRLKQMKSYQAEDRHQQFIENSINQILKNTVVKNGPFRGLIYPLKKACGSQLFPKLLGSYEAEIHPMIYEIISRNYTEIIDIGCAEGYYAVGLALRIPAAKIYAYDSNPEAQKLCFEMARLNKVQDRISIGSFCSAETLKNIPIRNKALIISDCEGYELDLFTAEVIDCLKQHDFLIEIHDFKNIHTSTAIRERFKNHFSLTEMDSLDDIKKALTYQYPELSAVPLEQKKMLLAEKRPASMQWFWIKKAETLEES